MLIALTGTPGTGKSSVSLGLQAKGWCILEVNDLAKRHGLLKSKDPTRDSYDLDLDELQEALEKESFSDGVLVGHLSHLLDVDQVIVLRCHPQVLAKRLETRKWPLAKIRENALAESLDIILAEAVDSEVPVFEINTTEMSLPETEEAVLSILAGEKEKYAIGNIDWSEEALKWS
ncbi:MAG TPA: adenylate kinase family protein [Methanomassiliicoccales archaeon]|nr:adenylate kinase family protein [Methanomassiliicoccales archaeon]HNX47379.1 adenylate kinase family protein [Methanomassiliicoccales archaeon]